MLSNLNKFCCCQVLCTMFPSKFVFSLYLKSVFQNSICRLLNCLPICPSQWDANECGDFTNGGCEQLCVNHPGGFNCTCKEGYEVRADDPTRCRRESNTLAHWREKISLICLVIAPLLHPTWVNAGLICSSCVWPTMSELRSVCGAKQLRLSSRLPWCGVLRYKP